MCFKMMYNIITFKNVFQYQMANFNSVKLQFLLYQRNMSVWPNSAICWKMPTFIKVGVLERNEPVVVFEALEH